MSISERYRQLAGEVEELLRRCRAAVGEGGPELTWLGQAAQTLDELREGVGEIPRMRLEAELTPVLLKAHNRLDRARLLLEEQGEAARAGQVWELEQAVYRLLNDL